MRFYRGLLRVGLLFTLGISTTAYAIEARELNQTWVAPGLTNSAVVPGDKLQTMLDLMAEDSETNELLQSVMTKFGANGPEDIGVLLRICVLGGDTAGDTTMGGGATYSRAMVPGGLPDAWPGEFQQKKQEAFAFREKMTATQQELRVIRQPSVCLKSGETVLNSFITFVHELKHLAGRDLFPEDDVLNYRNEREFAEKELFIAGGEFESFVMEGRLIKRLKKRYPIQQKWAVEKYFDDDGNLVNRAGLAAFILDDLGYRHKFEDEFRDMVGHEYNSLVRDLHRHEKKLMSATRRNLEMENGNVSRLQGLLDDMIKLKDSPKMIEEVRARRDAHQRLALFYRDYLGRIEAETQRLRRRMQEIDARFKHFFARGELVPAA